MKLIISLIIIIFNFQNLLSQSILYNKDISGFSISSLYNSNRYAFSIGIGFHYTLKAKYDFGLGFTRTNPYPDRETIQNDHRNTINIAFGALLEDEKRKNLFLLYPAISYGFIDNGGRGIHIIAAELSILQSYKINNKLKIIPELFGAVSIALRKGRLEGEFKRIHNIGIHTNNGFGGDITFGINVTERVRHLLSISIGFAMIEGIESYSILLGFSFNATRK
jgi:hypothetical protein